MNKPFHENLYEATLDTCQQYGVPEDLAEKASQIIASDDAELPNLGRDPEEQAVINQVVPYLQKGDK
jgi:hypothetical protein